MKKEIEIKLREKLRKKMLSLPDFAVDFLYFLENSKEIRTRIEYAKDIALFLEFLIESQKCSKENINQITEKDLEQLQERDILDFLDYLTRYKRTYIDPLGKKVVREFTNTNIGKSRKLATLHKLFDYLLRNKRISKDITKGVEIKIPSKVRINDRLTSEEIQLLFSTIMDDVKIGSQHELKFHEKVKFRDYIIILLLAYTGIRVSELVQLDIDDIHLDKKKIIVTRKGGNQQAITIPKRIIEDIEEYVMQRRLEEEKKAEKEPALFLSLHKKRIDPKTVRAMLEKYRKRSGIETKITPHVFRRTFGTNHYNTYHDMYLTAQILGHSTAETTRKFYADPSEERVARSMHDFDYENPANKKLESKLEKLAKKLGVSVEELMKELG